ncbi:OprD family outer membrane porin [Hydrogenimonas thermophila]|uniref:Outer membrane porin, OprD family n=1 Tax=Hydrogenimonas thermophila TaxID=223786 RepID=A0A1I5T869_9BACT|nr:OprD family outer membrane porin [Hydrogenimonas thermophila]SFP79239.1 outer membrane porin, OprD family [Hydrogenimonas thermophila]
MKKLIFLFAISLSLTKILAADMVNEQIDITTIRNYIGDVQPLEHTKAQIRFGFLNLNMADESLNDTKSFAIGGHLHLGSKRWHGVKVSFESYAVKDLTLLYNSDDTNRDFFDSQGNGFITLSQAFIDGKFKNTTIKLGRQMINTPHLDSDDIRMMPNYFQAFVIKNSDFKNLELTVAKVDKMAGWENGLDSSKFIDIEKVAGSDKNSDGLYMLSAVYNGIEDFNFQAWYYYLRDLYDIIYLEIVKEFKVNQATFTLGLQYDRSNGIGSMLLGDIGSSTYGITLHTHYSGLQLLFAYNKDLGKTGAIGSFGGGPFFTSLEDQTIDAIGEKGDAWIIGCEYNFKNFKLSTIYGSFQAKNKEIYNVTETDFISEYEISNRFSVTLAYAMINDKNLNNGYNQLRFIMNYNFW